MDNASELMNWRDAGREEEGSAGREKQVRGMMKHREERIEERRRMVGGGEAKIGTGNGGER